MQKRLKQLKIRLANYLDKIARWLGGSGNSGTNPTKFIDLAPTDEADAAGVYSEALSFATKNTKVTNIALTGPYGSGKSSIVQTFLKTYPRPALHISLAAFAPDPEGVSGKVSRQEIERSILQQMLYGAEANKLPLSRFKRIQSPGTWSIFRSLFILLGLLSLFYVCLERDAVASGGFFSPLALSNGIRLGSFALAIVFLWVTLHHFYVASFGISLKSISLKDIEMRPSSDNPDSILNRHLDEIIYFFQTTKYDLVVIEDLDRFENADIFVTLREINGLVNENAGVNRIIRFLYALRDDMFVNTDRTKFFEFIIPVIPIINSSNSIDKVLEQGKRLALDDRLDRQFLREVSRYLNDLRLIQNIFNEYAIYVANLESDEENVLDANKLLAILIYKNVYPRDFEQLHRGEGNLAGILARQDELIAAAEASQRLEIAKLEQQIEDAEQQTPSNLKELRQIYSMALVARLPPNTSQISHDGQSWITLQQLVDEVSLERIMEATSIICVIQGSRQRLDISSLQTEVDSQKTYLQRKSEIETKAATVRSAIVRRISELRGQIGALRRVKFNQLMRLNSDRIDDLFSGFGEKGDLARFLILEGHLDDTYYQYTSLFHSGRLSPNDNKFLIQIRAFITPAPDFPVDNPNEVIAAMRPEDFGQSYVLNLKVLDSLLDDQLRYTTQLEKLFDFISSDFEGCEDFLQAFYASGRNREAFITGLSSRWRGYARAILASPRAISHVTQLVANMPDASLRKLTANAAELPDFVAKKLPQILAQASEIAPERLAVLGFEIEDFAAISEHPAVARFMFEKGLFKTTIPNLEYIYLNIMGQKDPEPFSTANYTTLRATNNEVLLIKLEKDFAVYFVSVVLNLKDNSCENAEAIIAVLQHQELESSDVGTFLDRQVNLLPTLDGVPVEKQAMLFRHHAVLPTWRNCLAFMQSEAYDEEILISYLGREDVCAHILEEGVPADAETLPLRQLIVRASGLPDDAYQNYVRALPSQFDAFPEGLELSKLRILIDAKKVIFSEESVEALDDDDLRVRHVATNIAEFLGRESFEMDDDFLEKLLRSQISVNDKRAVVGKLDLKAAAAIPARAALVGQILDATDVDVANLDSTVAQSLIVNSRPIDTQISLFNKLEGVLTNDDVRQVLVDLPRPFSDIKTGYLTPRLPKNPQNLTLVRWLAARKIISSWSEGGFFMEDIRVNLFRR